MDLANWALRLHRNLPQGLNISFSIILPSPTLSSTTAFFILQWKTCLWAELEPWAEHSDDGDWDFRISDLLRNPDGTDI